MYMYKCAKHLPIVFIVLVSIDTTHHNGAPIVQELAIHNACVAESKLRCFDLAHGTIHSTAELHHKAVHCRLLGTPQGNLTCIARS